MQKDMISHQFHHRRGNMRRSVVACLALSVSTVPALAQEAPALDNYTVQRLIVRDGQGQILLERNTNGWMTPALRSRKRESVREGLDRLARELGITIGDVKLAAIYTYKFDEIPADPAHAAISYRTHYTAKRTAGEVVAPRPEEAKEYRWLTPGEAYRLIDMTALRTETRQIVEHPGTLWGGSFLITFRDGKLTYSEQAELPYALR